MTILILQKILIVWMIFGSVLLSSFSMSAIFFDSGLDRLHPLRSIFVSRPILGSTGPRAILYATGWQYFLIPASGQIVQ